MLKTSYPFKINNSTIPFPDSITYNVRKITNEFQTENGRTRFLEVRNRKMEFSLSFTLSSRWLKRFLELAEISDFSFQYYNAQDNTYYSCDHCYIDGESISYNLIELSQYADNTEGLYRLTFDLCEY